MSRALRLQALGSSKVAWSTFDWTLLSCDRASMQDSCSTPWEVHRFSNPCKPLQWRFFHKLCLGLEDREKQCPVDTNASPVYWAIIRLRETVTRSVYNIGPTSTSFSSDAVNRQFPLVLRHHTCILRSAPWECNVIVFGTKYGKDINSFCGLTLMLQGGDILQNLFQAFHFRWEKPILLFDGLVFVGDCCLIISDKGKLPSGFLQFSITMIVSQRQVISLHLDISQTLGKALFRKRTLHFLRGKSSGMKKSSIDQCQPGVWDPDPFYGIRCTVALV